MDFHLPIRFRSLAWLAAGAMGLPLGLFLAIELTDPDGFRGQSRAELGQPGGNQARGGASGRLPAVTLPEDALEGEENEAPGADSPDSRSAATQQAALLSRFGGIAPTAIEGIGGSGAHRAVKVGGAWIPLFSGSATGLADGSDAKRLPLLITSGSPPRFRVGESIAHSFEAVGGVPPYRWEMSLTASGFQIDAGTGLFTGRSDQPLAASLAITVRDAEDAEDSALYTLAIDDGIPLVIDTGELPNGTAGNPYTATLSASGGLLPYQWSATGPLPAGLFLDASSGQLAGTTSQAIETELEFRVVDAGGAEATRWLRLVVAGEIEILDRPVLRTSTPGSPYLHRFTAEGGVPPHQFRLLSGSLPLDAQGRPWQLTPEGELIGSGSPVESATRFIIEVVDAVGATAQKEFRLSNRRLLTVVPSREKAGLAWSPREVSEAAGFPVAGVTVVRAAAAGAPGAVVYQGTGSNFIDRGLVTGATYAYALFAHPAGSGEPVEIGRAEARLLPFTQSRGVAGVSADPFVDAVKRFTPLASGGHGAGFLPLNVTGPPSGRGTFAPASQPSEVVSLHAATGRSGGVIELAFVDNIVELGPGEDFTIFENVFFIGGDPDQRFMEPATVSVALFEGEWHRFPIDVVPPSTVSSTPVTMDPYYYNRGFAGRNATTGGDPTDPTRSGGDSFDVDRLGVAGLTWIRYIRIQSTGHGALRDDFGGDPVQHIDLLGSLSGDGSSGFDLDAVSAVNY